LLNTGPEGTLNYSYDNLRQLTGVSGARTESYSYDINGNRTMTGYTTGPGNRLTSDGTHNYSYDDEGNLTLKTRLSDGQRWEYTWDHRNRLTQVLVKTSGGTVLTEDRFTYEGKWCQFIFSLDGPGLVRYPCRHAALTPTRR
jgi:YD repeat-containing protein